MRRFFPTNLKRFVSHLLLLGLCLTLNGCALFGSHSRSELVLDERPIVAILPIGLDVEIKKLTTLKTVEGTLSAEEEARQITEAVQEIQREARWLFQSSLATRQAVRFVPLDTIDQAVVDLHMSPGMPPSEEQLSMLGGRLGADLIVVATILDYGKVRWQWLAAASLADMTAETIILGLATAWNPPVLFANLGYEVLTNTPLYFGGGYVFGLAFRPVRVEARAFETRRGDPLWQQTEVAVYTWTELRQLSKEDQRRKEFQLRVNLATAMEELADSLAAAGITVSQLGEALPVPSVCSNCAQAHHTQAYSGPLQPK